MRSASGAFDGDTGNMTLKDTFRFDCVQLRYFSAMQRNAILALLLLSSLTAWTQKKEDNQYKKQTTVSPTRIDLFGSGQGVTLDIGKDKKQIAPLPPPALPVSIDYHNVGAPMPPIRIVTSAGEVYTEDKLSNGANLFVMLFNPTCEHCEDMTAALEKNIRLFKQSNIVLMAAPTMLPYLAGFENGLRTKDYPLLKIGLDSARFIDRTFNYENLPQINIYGADRKLIKTFSGIETIDSLKAYIQ